MNVGRPRVSVDTVAIERFRASGLSYRQIARELGIGLGTVRRAAQERAKTVPKLSRGDCPNSYRACADDARFLAG